jgi:5-methyltetrahydrofolate--homocysteine methyltransferase
MNPPFTGAKIVTDIPLDEVYKLIDTHLLFAGHWRFKRTKDSEAAYQKILKEKAGPAFEEWKKKCKEERIFEPKVVYGYFEKFQISNLKSKICSLPSEIVPLQLVTLGEGAVKKAQWLFASHRYTDYLYLHGLAAATTEALAEYWHKKILRELDIPFNAGKRLPVGSRISPGYPSWPNLADQKVICELLGSEKIGVTLTESFQLVPEYSTSAMIII